MLGILERICVYNPLRNSRTGSRASHGSTNATGRTRSCGPEPTGLSEQGNCGDAVTEHPTEPEPIHPALLCRTGELLQIQPGNRCRQTPKFYEICFLRRRRALPLP